MHGGTSAADREPFVAAAHFVCELMGAMPLGLIVLGNSGRCVATNTTLDLLMRGQPAGGRLIGTHIQFGSAELKAAFIRATHGESVLVETDSPPVLESGHGHWRLYFLPFAVDGADGAAVLFEDLTDHRRTSETFRAAEQQFRRLVDSAADGIAIFRAQIVLYLNPEAVRLFGFQSSDELVGTPLLELVELNHRASFDLHLAEIAAGTGADLFETVFLRRDRTSFPIECRTSRTHVDEMGAGYLFFRDITERQRLQARREIARRVDALATFSSAVGVELQNHITELRRWIDRAKSTSTGATATIAELQSLTDSLAIRANAYSLSDQTAVAKSWSTTIEELLARVCNSLQFDSSAGSGPARPATARWHEPAQDLLVDLEPAPYPVRGEPNSIEAGLTLLAKAALKARITDSPLCIRGARLLTGVGDRPATYRLSIASGRVKGSGSGAVCVNSTSPATAVAPVAWEVGGDLEILAAFARLQAQGCWVEVQPCVGGGQCFEVELLLDAGHSTAAEVDSPLEATATRSGSIPGIEEAPADTERSPASEAHLVSRAAAPVLICDDEARLVALTAGLLREFGFEVLTVRSGVDAIRTVAQHPVDIVILDVNLPGEDSQEIVAQLRSTSQVSVILSSGYTEEDIEPELLHDQAVKAFLAKPYGVETLVDTIDRVRQRANHRCASDAAKEL